MAPALNAIGVIVTDIGKSLAFYRRLGLDLPAGDQNQPHVETTLPGGTRLMLDTAELIRSFDPDWVAPTGSSRISLAFQCADPAEVDRVYDDMVGAGYEGHKQPWDAEWRMRYALLRDPDGNSVDLYAHLPGT